MLKADYGLDLPRLLQVDFSRRVQEIADRTGKEITPAAIWQAFRAEYVDRQTPFEFLGHTTLPTSVPSERRIEARVRDRGRERVIAGRGNGPVAAYVDALTRDCGAAIKVRDYHQHATGAGADASSASYIEAEDGRGRVVWGVGLDANIVAATLKAVTSAANRALDAGPI